jgi:hypothetical protein
MKVIPVNVYSRCCGYYTNYNALHAGKKSEWDDRKLLNVSNLEETLKSQRTGVQK